MIEFLSTVAWASGWFRKTRIDSPSFKMRSGPGWSRCCTPTCPSSTLTSVVSSSSSTATSKIGAAHRNHRRRRAYPVVIGLPAAQLLNVDLHTAEEDIQQVPPGAGIFAKNDTGVGKNLEGTAIGNLKDRETVWSGYDNLARLHGVADIQHPGGIIAQYGNLPVQSDYLGSAALGVERNDIDARRRPRQPVAPSCTIYAKT